MKGYRAVGVGDKVHEKGAGGQEPGDEGESAFSIFGFKII